MEIIKNHCAILEDVRANSDMQKLWCSYQKKYAYANGISFEDTINAIMLLLKKIA